MWQRTLARKIVVSGRGIHTGEITRIIIHPAEPNYGIKFRVKNLIFDTSLNNVTSTYNATTLSYNGIKVMTVEHLLSALNLLGITNCLIELTGGNEIPIFDGGIFTWLKLLSNAGSIIQTGYRKRIFKAVKRFSLVEPLNFMVFNRFNLWNRNRRSWRSISIYPNPYLRITYHLNLYGKLLTFDWSEYSEYQILKFASTFGHIQDAFQLWQKGLALGANFDNTLVVFFNGNSRPMLHPAEPAIHKIVDLLGDIYLLGGKLKAHILVHNGGHSLHIKAIRFAIESKAIVEEKA